MLKINIMKHSTKTVQNWRFDYNFRTGTFVLFIIGLFAYLYLTICIFVPVKLLETLLVPS